MSLAQTINDLRGATTFQDAMESLTSAYQNLTHLGHPQAARAVIQARNRIEGYLCIGNSEAAGFSWGEPSCYDGDQALPGFLSMSLSQLAQMLRNESLPGAQDIDPASKPDLADKVESWAGEVGEFAKGVRGLQVQASFILLMALIGYWYFTR